jgi:hypothetical protein
MTRTTFPLGLGAVALLGMPAMGFAPRPRGNVVRVMNLPGGMVSAAFP